MKIKEGWMTESEKLHLLDKWREGKLDCTMEYLEEAFGTADFTSALVDASNVALMQGYGEVPATWQIVSKVVNKTNFKTNNIVTAGDMGKLEKRIESEPATEDKPTDRKETYAMFRYNKLFGISMEAQANDETGTLMDNFRTWGHAAVRTLNDFVWGTSGLLGGAGSYTFSDSELTFSTSHTNANYATSTALTEANLVTAIVAMRNQPDEGGTEVLGVPPATLNVAPAIETLARRLVESPTVMVLERDTDNNAAATLTGTVNAIKGYGLKVNVVDSLAASEWVLAANPAIYPVVEMGFKNGNTVPTISFQRPDSDAEFMTGTRYSKCELVFGGAPMSWKTIYKGTNE